MSLESDKLASRIVETIEISMQCELSDQIDRLLELKACESPIEALLGSAIWSYDRLFSGYDHLVISSEADIAHYGTGARLLVHQYKFENYRIDWCLIDPPHRVFIECDGHDFHERTKEQAARDRQKDRAIQQAGFPVLRFTGSEIYRNPIDCAEQVILFVGDLFYTEAMKRA